MGLKCLWLDCWSEEGGPAKRCTVHLVRNLGCVPSVGKIHQVLLDLERRERRMSWKRGEGAAFEALVSLAVGGHWGPSPGGMRRGVALSCEEAARDLGAGRVRVFFDITLPMIMPGIVSGMLLSFAMSFDDVIISIFVTGVDVNTLPILIYTQLKTGVTPKVNALCTLMFLATLLIVVLSALIGRMGNKKRT